MKQLAILLLVIVTALKALPQTSNRVNISGQIIDKETHNPLSAATVNCLLAKDSTQKTLVFTNKSGIFSLNNLLINNYILHITFLGYESQSIPITVTSEDSIKKIGLIEMKRTGLTLAEIEVVQTKVPVRFTKDTIEFNASLFRTKANAVVEDLLKKIPGIQIDNDGTIRANGKIVQNIMIDGRQLFSGGNPSIISKNLQADLIDKVQLIDRIQDQKNSPGLSNTQNENIINITIKKSKHNLLSGEISASAGTAGRFATKVNLSRFNENQQLMILGDGNNVNGVPDSKNMGSHGVQRSYNGGVSYSNEVSKKMTVGLNYLINDNRVTEKGSSIRNTIINDSNLLYNQETFTEIKNTSHDGSLQFDYKIDSLQSITISQQISLQQISNHFSSSYESTGSHSRKINIGTILNADLNRSSNFSSSLRYDKKFKKKNRFLSITVASGEGYSEDDGVAISKNIYFPINSETISDTINQNTLRKKNSKRLFLMINYTEPISNNGLLELSLVEDYSHNTSDIEVSNFNNHTKLYDIPTDSLSNSFRSTPVQHYAKLSWIYKKDKFDYSVSLASLLFNMKNANITQKEYYSTQSKSLLPEVNFNYLLDTNKKLRFSYRKNQDFPQLSQLQPIRDNSNPLNSKIGNQSLKPMSIHNIDITYNMFNISSLHSFSVNVNGRILRDQILNASWYDSLGRQTDQPININGGYTISINIDNNTPLKSKKSSINFSTKGVINRSMNYTNGTKIFHKDFTFSQSIGFQFEYKELFKCNIAGNLNYNQVVYSTIQSTSFHYFNGAISFTGDLNLPHKIVISTNVNYGWTTGRMEGYNLNPIIVHASISKSLFSHQQGIIKLQGFDLLRQNTNISRIVQNNYIQDTRTNSLQRFFLIGFSYFLGKR
ncbi:outer membrane beta-barrel protein [Chitinophaga sp. OAE865]|uniref:outer membrane beta-barrel protein n=1 Tax=Chitinophaga sp. OAE865 TaxID=2817898 RepID=UPI001AEA7135